ncbi:MAG TPA: SCO family protein [Burkholderiales bacterium]
MNLTRRYNLKLMALAPITGALPAWMASAEAVAHAVQFRGNYFPNVELTTHENRKVRFYDDLLKDRIVVINFMYTGCGDVCPLVTANLVKVQKLLGDRVGRDIFMYSVTLQPQFDTPQVLARYAELYGVGPGWWFLTGAPADVNLVRSKLGRYADPVVDEDITQHSGMIRFGNERYERWGSCSGGTSPEWIATSIRWMDGPATGSS